MSKDTRWSVEFHEETTKRIEELEAEGYVFPPAFKPRDWALAIACILVSGVFLLAGVAM
ncbi:hypothetical protein VU555_00555 [Enterobacter hormaechei]|uniref:hypothetical protein n=1 Tax=Enterobacter hormaechei TaxID=158836 RepID=UPI003CF0D409